VDIAPSAAAASSPSAIVGVTREVIM